MTSSANQIHHALALALGHLRVGDPIVAEGILASLATVFPADPCLADLLRLCHGLDASTGRDGGSTDLSFARQRDTFDQLRQGRRLVALGRPDHAAASFARAAALDPHDSVARAELAVIAWQRLGHPDEDGPELSASALLRTDLANLFLALASRFATGGSADRAAACLREALRLDPTNAFARDGLKRCIEGIEAHRRACAQRGDRETTAELERRLRPLLSDIVPMGPPKRRAVADAPSLPAEGCRLSVRREETFLRLTPERDPPAPRALLALDPTPILLPEHDEGLDGHSQHWEHREIARRFLDLGYAVDVVPFASRPPPDVRPFDVVFCMPEALSHLEPFLAPSCRRLLQLTGSNPTYQNSREQAWSVEFSRRTGRLYAPKRQIAGAEQALEAMRRADGLAFMGNEWTRDTYPLDLRPRLFSIGVTASTLAGVKAPPDYVSSDRHFLWYFGFGAVHKGLDRVLEVFRRHPRLSLHIVGQPHFEADFESAYEDLLYRAPNITLHGYLRGRSERLLEVARPCFCLIAPSCSEATSTAVVTALHIGLYPLISRDCGLTLPAGAGRYLETCTVEEIEAAVLDLHAAPTERLAREVATVQTFVHTTFSRHAWSLRLRSFLETHLGTR